MMSGHYSSVSNDDANATYDDYDCDRIRNHSIRYIPNKICDQSSCKNYSTLCDDQCFQHLKNKAVANTVDTVSSFSLISAYNQFSSEFALKKVSMPKTGLVWSYYHINSSSEVPPLVLLHGLLGTCSIFFLLLKALCDKGYNLISCEYPAYNSANDWCKGFDNFLDFLKVRKVHIFGDGLGGYLSQVYANVNPGRVLSIILNNSFNRTDCFVNIASVLRGACASIFSFLPHAILKKAIFNSLALCNRSNIFDEYDPNTNRYYSRYCHKYNDSCELLFIHNSLEFVNHIVDENLTSNDLGCRLGIQISGDPVCVSNKAIREKITIINSPCSSLPDMAFRNLIISYPEAKIAELKSGSDFPYLSHAEDVALFVEVHMRNCGVYVKYVDQEEHMESSGLNNKNSLYGQRGGNDNNKNELMVTKSKSPTEWKSQCASFFASDKTSTAHFYQHNIHYGTSTGRRILQDSNNQSFSCKRTNYDDQAHNNHSAQSDFYILEEGNYSGTCCSRDEIMNEKKWKRKVFKNPF